jgi:hypothetical protein
MSIFNKVANKVRGKAVKFTRMLPYIKNQENLKLYQSYVEHGVPKALFFDFNTIRRMTLDYVERMRVGNDVFLYKYSEFTTQPNIYSSAFACMIKSLYGELSQLDNKEKQAWLSYFDSFQSSDDGLFRDTVLVNELFEIEDWWGARHLAAILIIAYNALGSKPHSDFKFLEPFYTPKNIKEWLESRDWINRFDFVGNEVMNYGVLLQYSRDAFNNQHAGVAIKAMLDWLEKSIDSTTGLWGKGPFDSAEKLSRAVQGAYHIYPLFFYDKREVPYQEKIIDNVLATQNQLGGYGVKLNSSACEDIDSIEPLIRLTNITDYKRLIIKQSLHRALPWLLTNMNEDGGFVFRRNEPFVYGHKEMSSGINESSMFATWFRTLCLAYLINYFNNKSIYQLNRVPGYEFNL